MGVLDTISTFHDGKEYRLWRTVQQISNCFESTDIDTFRRVPPGKNLEDSLIKNNPPVEINFNKAH